MFVRDMDLTAHNASGQPQIGSCGGRELAIDTTSVSPLRRDGTARAGQPITTARLWTMLDAGKRPLTPKFPVKVGRLLVLAAEVEVERGDSAVPHRTETMERNLGVHGCPGLHSVTVGQASCHWHRRGVPSVQEVSKETRFL